MASNLYSDENLTTDSRITNAIYLLRIFNLSYRDNLNKKMQKIFRFDF